MALNSLCRQVGLRFIAISLPLAPDYTDDRHAPPSQDFAIVLKFCILLQITLKPRDDLYFLCLKKKKKEKAFSYLISTNINNLYVKFHFIRKTITHFWTPKTGLALGAELVITLEFSDVVSAWPAEWQLDLSLVLNSSRPGIL